MAKKTKAKKRDIFDTEDFDSEETVEAQTETEDEIPLEEIDPEKIEDIPIEEIDPTNIDIEDNILEIDEKSDGEIEDIEKEETEELKSNRATIVKCPHCGEEVLDMETCPVCGNPLKLTVDTEMSREDFDSMDPFNIDEEDIEGLKKGKEKGVSNIIDDDLLFSGLPYQTPSDDNYSPNNPDNI